MSKRSRLAVVLRARKLQEDVAKSAVLQARAAANDAADAVRRREHELDTSGVPTAGSAAAVIAALAARQSLAGAISAARHVHRAAEETTAERTAELANAAMNRQVMEKLMDRYHAEEIAEALAAEQIVLDEIAITAPQRAASQGVRS
jgi:flagellar export protein FliJ